jgi:ABC-2 type transport system permease protein
MNKTYLIFKQELLKTLRRTGFIILTLSLPVLALLGIAVSHIASGIAKPPPEANRIGFVDDAGGFTGFTAQGKITLVPFDSEAAARQALVKKDIAEYFIIPQDFVSTGVLQYFITQKELTPPDTTIAAVKNFISRNLLEGKVTETIITRVESPLNLATTTLNASGEKASQQGGYLNFIVPGIFSFMMGLSLVFTSTYVLQSLSEEKENRLMEILVSSVSTRQLLTGKVLGLGVAGLIQVVVWIISVPVLLSLASSSVGGILSVIQIPPGFWVVGVLYFILGYLLMATVSASIAAVTSTVQEAQGIAGIYTIFNFSPFWFLSLILLYPNNPAWVVLTLFPFTAPVLTLMRLGLTGIPGWQLAASLTVMALSVAGGLALASRLLRIYLLMYGKRPNIIQIVRNFRNA